jgi:hypothetical protein
MYNNMKSAVVLSTIQVSLFLAGAFFLMNITGCSSEGGGRDLSTPNSSDVRSGLFVDGPVHGLKYQTNTLSGTTDVNGMFYYHDGENVQFYIGDMNLGEAEGRPMITPIDLVPGAQDENDLAVTNMLCFLQTFDQDHNPQNGICITDEVSELCNGRQIDFNMTPVDFAQSYGMNSMMDQYYSSQGYGYTPEMVSTDSAKLHMQNTLSCVIMIVSDEIVKNMETIGITDPRSVYDFMDQNQMLNSQNILDYMSQYGMSDTQQLIDYMADQNDMTDNPQSMIDFMSQNNLTDIQGMMNYLNENGIMSQEELADMMNHPDNMSDHNSKCPRSVDDFEYCEYHHGRL